jgi:hypothetical protein
MNKCQALIQFPRLHKPEESDLCGRRAVEGQKLCSQHRLMEAKQKTAAPVVPSRLVVVGYRL